MQEDIVQQTPSVPPPTQNVLKNLIARIPKPIILVAVALVGIPLLLLVLKSPKSTPTTVKSEFALVESSPSDQQNGAPVIAQPTFVFSKKIGISEQDLPKYFSISPRVEGSWHLEKNKQVVYFSSDKKQAGTFPHTFDYRTAYQVNIDKSFHSDNGKSLGEDEQVTFRTQQNPEFGMTAYKSLFPVFTGDSVDLEINNYDENGQYGAQIQQQESQPYDVTIQKATKEELLAYFSYKKNSYLALQTY